MPSRPQMALVLGAGINGAAIARELILSGVSTTVVDRADISAGATAYSSRLIHGGLRYLEYGEFDLVRESLAERTRLLRLAPQYVKPLRLFVPVSDRFGGFVAAGLRFLGWKKKASQAGPPPARGLWLVRMGLWMYDKYARDPLLPKHESQRVGAPGTPAIDPSRYRWTCSYYDAQIRFPERFTLALLDDARQIAIDSGLEFELFNYHEAIPAEGEFEIRSVSTGTIAARKRFDFVINAAGAWVDHALADLKIESPPLMGGTKGSHLVLSNARLAAAIGEDGIYAEAKDGRPVFILPFGDQTLVGTTDERYEGDPADAVASPAEVEYLLGTVNEILPSTQVSAADIVLTYSGVRPLPRVGEGVPAAITRRHALVEHQLGEIPVWSVVGGKLTTCRSLAEQTVATARARLHFGEGPTSRERGLPGGEDFPFDRHVLEECLAVTARVFGYDSESIHRMWALLGTRLELTLAEAEGEELIDGGRKLAGVAIPMALARWSIRHEWPRTVSDLVERRLMLLYEPGLSRETLVDLAQLLAEAKVITAAQIEGEVDAAAERLRRHFGRRI